MVSKTAPVDELLGILRDVAAGELRMPALDHDAMEAALSRLGTDDLAVAGMLLARVGVREIAETLGSDPRAMVSRAVRIIGELQAPDRVGRRPPVGDAERAFG